MIINSPFLPSMAGREMDSVDSGSNGLTDRFCAYANALVVLTDTPSFPDEIGSKRDLPENFQRRKSW